MKQILLFITSGPDTFVGRQAVLHAEKLSQLSATIRAVFFYGDGVQNANQLRTPPSDEFDCGQQWREFAKKNACELIVCSAAAQRRGVLDTSEAEYHQKNGFNLADGFRIGGLAEYVEHQGKVDEVIQL